MSFRNDCYMEGNGQKNFAEAQADCRSKTPPMELISIRSQEEQDFFESEFGRSDREYTWLGVRQELTPWTWEGNEYDCRNLV